jgi:hypothetical protein
MSSAAPPTVRALWTVAVVNRFALRGLAHVGRGGCLGAVLDGGYGGSRMMAHCQSEGWVDEGEVAGVRRESGLGLLVDPPNPWPFYTFSRFVWHVM